MAELRSTRLRCWQCGTEHYPSPAERPTPKRRPDPRLSNPRPDLGPGRVGAVLLLAAFLVVGVAVILSIWAQTCGLGVAC